MRRGLRLLVFPLAVAILALAARPISARTARSAVFSCPDNASAFALPLSWGEVPPCAGQPVCARLLYLRDASTIVETAWGESGVSEKVVWQAPSDGSFPWQVVAISVSPDGAYAALELSHAESGGPLHLLDLRDGTIANLSSAVGLSLAGEGAEELDEEQGWVVLGWAADAKHLLVAAEAQSALWWLDLDEGSSTPISLGADGPAVACGQSVALDAPGPGVVFIAGAGSRREEVRYHALDTGFTSLLASLPLREGRALYPRLSPDGSALAYVTVRPQSDGTGRYSLRLRDLPSGEARLLMECDRPLSEPRWSPDSSTILIASGEQTSEGFLSPECDSWRGSVWLLSARADGQRPLGVSGVARAAWAEGGRLLVLTCPAGNTGLARVEAPSRAWRMGQGTSPARTCALPLP